MSQLTNPWRGWVRNYMATRDINQLEMANIWLGACLAGGFVPPSLGAEALSLLLELAAMPTHIQAQVAASFAAARCA